MSRSTPVHATEFSPRDKSHKRGSPSCLGFVLLPAPTKAVVLVLVRIWNCAKRGVREVHSTVRAEAVSPNDRAAWDDADDNFRVSSVFLLQRMFSGFGFVGNRHNARCGLDSPSNSPVPNHGATSVPSMSHLLETNPILPRKTRLPNVFENPAPQTPHSLRSFFHVQMQCDKCSKSITKSS